MRRVLNALSTEGNPAAGLELLMDKIRTTSSTAGISRRNRTDVERPLTRPNNMSSHLLSGKTTICVSDESSYAQGFKSRK